MTNTGNQPRKTHKERRDEAIAQMREEGLLTDELQAQIDAIVIEAVQATEVVVDKKSIRGLSDDEVESLRRFTFVHRVQALMAPLLARWECAKSRFGRGYFVLNGEAVPEADNEKMRLRNQMIDYAMGYFIAQIPGHDAFTWRELASNEQTRRTRNATIARNKAERANKKSPKDLYEVGETVGVYAMGYWYTGTILRFNRNGRAIIEYTSGAGVPRERTCDNDRIRKADAAA